MKKGFTLIELLAVIAIVAILVTLIGSNFMKLIGNTDSYENENVYKYLNEAACVYIDSNDKSPLISLQTCTFGDIKYNCHRFSSSYLYDAGYIDENAGLLKSYSIAKIKNFQLVVYWKDHEKICCVQQNQGVTATGKGACQ